MAPPTQKIQAAKGTRDFYPTEMAARRHVEAAWRSASIDCGFEEIDGPTFEHLELYTIKSGEGIVNELFSFTRAGGESTYALRPEFTPTLARMVAAMVPDIPDSLGLQALVELQASRIPARMDRDGAPVLLHSAGRWTTPARHHMAP